MGQARWGPEPAAVTAAPPPQLLGGDVQRGGDGKGAWPFKRRAALARVRVAAECGLVMSRRRVGAPPRPDHARAALGPWPETAAGAAPTRRVRGGYAEGGWAGADPARGAGTAAAQGAAGRAARMWAGERLVGAAGGGSGRARCPWSRWSRCVLGMSFCANPGFHCAAQRAGKP